MGGNGTIAWIGEGAGGCPPAVRALGALACTPEDPAIARCDAVLAAAGLLARVHRALADRVPIVVIGAPADPRARAALLDAGATEVYDAAPDPLELAARLRALARLRRPGPIAAGDLAIDPVDRVATRGGRALPLHPREFAVLLALARARGATVGREELYRTVWGRGFDPGTNVVAVTVSRLRAKLHAHGAPVLRTGRGGYRLSFEA